MAILTFLLQIFASTMMLLFAVRLVRTGIERRFGALFETLLTRQTNGLYAASAGMGLAMLIQSSAAVSLLLTGFVAAGLVGFPLALAGVLGADLGSALIIQALSFDLAWLQPVLLAAGGWLYLKTDRANLRLIGRILLGVAFILLSLTLLRDAVEPIKTSNFLPAVAGYLSQDYITAFLVGAALAFVMHSSVAAILICVTLVQIGALPFAAGLSLVLGANLGSALIPIWLTRDMSPTPRRIPLANFLMRGAMALVFLLAINLFDLASHLQFTSPGQSLIFAHIGFNALLLVTMLGLVRLIEQPMSLLLPEPVQDRSVMDHFAEALDPLNHVQGGSTAVAMSSVKQELLQMTTQIERMFRPILDLYEQDDSDAIAALWQEDERVNARLASIRRFVASMPRHNMNKADKNAARSMVEYAIRLEAAGDTVSKRLTRLCQAKHIDRARFSQAGWAEIRALHTQVMESFSLARHVLLVDDVECARRLVLDKAEVKRGERASRKAHLKRLERGYPDSLGSSDLHLETLRAFRDLHGHLAAVAYPILYRNGQVLETRLVTEPYSQKADS